MERHIQFENPRLRQASSKLQFLSSLVATKPVPITSGRQIIQSPTYIVKAKIGTPPQTLLMVVDTSSDAAWIPCNGCVGCSSNVFNSIKSTTCKNLGCQAAQCKQVPNPTCLGSSCSFNMTYGGSSIAANLSQETFTLAIDSIPGCTFGCIQKNSSRLKDIERDQSQYGNAHCLSSYYSVFVARLTIMVMQAILIGLLTILTWHFTRIYTAKLMSNLAYGLRYELLQRPVLRMWNILNSTTEITVPQVKLSDYAIKRNSNPTSQAEEVKVDELLRLFHVLCGLTSRSQSTTLPGAIVVFKSCEDPLPMAEDFKAHEHSTSHLQYVKPHQPHNIKHQQK
ncbi:hypothetical protein FF1_014037 [Malus domestica]